MLVKLSTVSFSEDLVQGTESREGLLCLSRWRCRILASFWVWSFTHSKISLPCWVRNWKSPSPVLQPLKFKAEGVNQLTCSAVNLASKEERREGWTEWREARTEASKEGIWWSNFTKGHTWRNFVKFTKITMHAFWHTHTWKYKNLAGLHLH